MGSKGWTPLQHAHAAVRQIDSSLFTCNRMRTQYVPVIIDHIVVLYGFDLTPRWITRWNLIFGSGDACRIQTQFLSIKFQKPKASAFFFSFLFLGLGPNVMKSFQYYQYGPPTLRLSSPSCTLAHRNGKSIAKDSFQLYCLNSKCLVAYYHKEEQ